MAPVLRARGPRSDGGSAQEQEDRAQAEIRPAMSAPAGGSEVPASSRPKQIKASRETDASPNTKKTRDAPSNGTEEGLQALPEADALDPSGEVVVPPANEKGAAMREEDGAAGAEGDASPVTNAAAAAASPKHKKRGAVSPRPKRGKKTGSSEEEPEAAEKEDCSGKAPPELNVTADKTDAASSPRRKKRSKPSGDIPTYPKRKRGSKRAKEVRKAAALPLDEFVKLCLNEEGAKEGIATPKRIASPAKLHSYSNKEKKPAVERSWSMEDELRILTALAEHAQAHDGALLEASNLFAALSSSFDRRDANADKLANKVRKLKGRYERVRSHGCPTDDHGHRLFELCEIVWGSCALRNSSPGSSIALRRSLRKTNSISNVVPEEPCQEDGGEHTDEPTTGTLIVDIGSVPFVKDGDGSGKYEGNVSQVDQDKQAKVTYVRREFSELSRLYPFLAEEVKRFADTHSSGELTMAAFQTIADDEARDLDARCKKQRIDMFNLEMSQADLTKALLCTLAGRMN